MTQISRPEMNVENVAMYLNINPGATNSMLYDYFGADDVKKKSYLRKRKERWGKKKKKKKNDLSQASQSVVKSSGAGSVGTQSQVNKINKNTTQLTTTLKPQLQLPLNDPGFEKFCKFFSFPTYFGLYKWQVDCYNQLHEAKYEKCLVHRKSGKSVLYDFRYQYAMQYKGFDILLLGWTRRYKQIAVYVFNFFDLYGLILKDNRTSPFHFKTINGGSFDCYLITSKETLGSHAEGAQDRFERMSEEDWVEYKALFNGNFEEDEEKVFNDKELKDYIKARKASDRKLWIAIDDPIDMSFRKERHKEETLELHFDSTLYGIQPDKWSFTGTRKFEGDFFDFVTDKFGDELVSYVRGIRDLDGSLLCPEVFTHPDEATYEKDLKAGKEDLAKVRKHVGEYVWFSDFEQNPHPITHAVFDLQEDSFVIVEKRPLVRHHDLSFIYVDRATTTHKKSDYTGVVIGIREKGTGTRIVTHDLTDKIPLEHLLFELSIYCRDFHNAYPQVYIVMVIEKQGGGDDMVASIRIRNEFERDIKQPDGSVKHETVHNYVRDYCVIVEVHNTGDKVQRISDRLEASINNKRIMFMSYLKNSMLVKSINEFPYCAYFDPIDALATGDFEIVKRSVSKFGSPVKDLEESYNRNIKEDKSLRNVTSEDLEELLLKGHKKEVVFES